MQKTDENLIYFEEDGEVYKAEWTETYWPVSPRSPESYQHGTMIFKNYESLKEKDTKDQTVDDYSAFFRSGLKNSYDGEKPLEELSERELFEEWKKTKSCVVPLNVYTDTADEGCSPARLSFDENGKITNTGICFAEKETKVTEKDLIEDICRLSDFISGNVHDLNFYHLDKSRLDWELLHTGMNIFGSSLVERLNADGHDLSRRLSEWNVSNIRNDYSISEFKAGVFKEFLDETMSNLPDFKNNAGFAAKCTMKSWKAKEVIAKPDDSGLSNPVTLKLNAFKEYLKDNRVTDLNFISFLESQIEKKRSLNKSRITKKQKPAPERKKTADPERSR